MEKQKFQCRTCGAILIGEHARREHCQTHHPGTHFDRLDVFFNMEYKVINGDEPTSDVKSVKITKLKADKNGNITYVAQNKAKNSSSFDCSRAIPINVPGWPRSSSTDDLFEFAVKRVAEIHMGKPSLLDSKTTAQWCNICFGYPGLKHDERQQYILRIKDKFGAYFKRGGFKYGFDFEQIVRYFPHYFKGGEGYTPKKTSV